MAFDPAALRALGWRHAQHQYDSPSVSAARQVLQQRNGISGLETVSPTQADYAARAAELFHRDGFVVVTDVRCFAMLPLLLRLCLWAVSLERAIEHSSRVTQC